MDGEFEDNLAILRDYCLIVTDEAGNNFKMYGLIVKVLESSGVTRNQSGLDRAIERGPKWTEQTNRRWIIRDMKESFMILEETE